MSSAFLLLPYYLNESSIKVAHGIHIAKQYEDFLAFISFTPPAAFDSGSVFPTWKFCFTWQLEHHSFYFPPPILLGIFKSCSLLIALINLMPISISQGSVSLPLSLLRLYPVLCYHFNIKALNSAMVPPPVTNSSHNLNIIFLNLCITFSFANLWDISKPIYPKQNS